MIPIRCWLGLHKTKTTYRTVWVAGEGEEGRYHIICLRCGRVKIHVGPLMPPSHQNCRCYYDSGKEDKR